MIWDVIIVGGGPAGLMAAAMLKNKKVLLLEKMSCIGSKILLSGAGQCNITHGGSIESYEQCYGDKWRFVREALFKYNNEDVQSFMKKNGLDLVTLDNGKVFPASLKAADVNKTLLDVLQKNQVNVNLNEKVTSVEQLEHWQVTTDKGCYDCEQLIIATGGLTYPSTGSTGDGYALAKALDVPLIDTRFALAPVYISDYSLQSLSGLSFKDASISVYRNKKVGDYQGDLLITHFGYSGPVVLNNSRYFRNGDTIRVNFTNFKDKQTLETAFLKLCQEQPKKSVKNIVQSNFLLTRLTEKLFDLLSIDVETKCSDLKKQDRKKLLNAMFEYESVIGQVGKAHIAMVTAGGISTKALNHKTYESKKLAGLYFIGECVDVDGDTGGYNIQFAFSSAVAAARHILGE